MGRKYKWMTAREQEAIRILTRANFGQGEIAEMFGRSSNSVYKVQKAAGLSNDHHGYKAWTATPAELDDITAMARTRRYTGAHISRVLGTPYIPTMKLIHMILDIPKSMIDGRLDSYLRVRIPEQVHDEQKKA
jgi:hypothetical protein